jgi:hypothetical protein
MLAPVSVSSASPESSIDPGDSIHIVTSAGRKSPCRDYFFPIGKEYRRPCVGTPAFSFTLVLDGKAKPEELVRLIGDAKEQADGSMASIARQ